MPHGKGARGGTELTDILRKAGNFCDLFQTSPDIKAAVHRRLTREEILAVESRGSVCRDWTRVRITEETNLNLIRSCIFAGDVLIHLPSGELSDSRITGCTLNGPLAVRSCSLIKGYSLMPGCTVEFSGVITWENSDEFLPGVIQAGLETGERSIPIIPEMTHLDAAFLASGEGRELSRRASLLIGDQVDAVRGIIGEDVVLSCCPFIRGCVFLQGSRAEASGPMRGSLLMSGAAAKDGAQLYGSVLQWNAEVSSLAVVKDSVVGECSTVEKHGVLTCSFLGADSVLGQGEITASVAGPLTAMHHQSLLIAALWPGGRGNVGYGANVGSNHTSRVPDQEIRPGTGLFFGLSTAVKYPADLSRSPYSVIATGVTTLSQKVEYPFSLIVSSGDSPEGTPAGWCRLVPGWMLHSNLYSVLRNQWKYSNRTRAVHTPVETKVFTDEVLSMVRTALGRLESGSTEGAGRNFITEDDRLSGIQVYRKCLRTFELDEELKSGEITRCDAGEFLDLIEQIRESALSSRMKDFNRGGEIIDDYLDVRLPLEEDPFISVLLKKTVGIEETLHKVMGQTRLC